MIQTLNSNTEFSLKKTIKWSLIGHGIVFVLLIIQQLVFPSALDLKLSSPTLRVDIVGLPDILKKDLMKVDPYLTADKATPSKPAAKDEETAQDDELALNPKKAEEAKKKKEEKDRQSKMKSAVQRMKALDRIKNEVAESEEQKQVAIIKGNKVSPGTSLSGDAREADAPSYLDQIRDRLQQNWALPVWLTRQPLSAQVKLFIDGRGMVVGMRWVKSSGNPQFDEAIRKTITDSQPFSTPPKEIVSGLQSNGVLVGFPL